MSRQVVDPSLGAEAPPPWLRSLVFAALFGSAVLVAGWTKVPESELRMVGPAAGIGALWLLGVIRDRRQALVDAAALALTAAVITVVSDMSWGPASVFGLAHVVQAMSLAWLFTRSGGPAPRLHTPVDLALLVRASMLACVLGAALFSAGFVWAITEDGLRLTGSELAMTALTIYVRNLAGAVLIVAAGVRIADPQSGLDLIRDMRQLDLPMVLIAVAATFVVVFGVVSGTPVVALVMFPLMTWLGIRASTTLNTWMLILFSALVTSATLLGYGPLASLPTHQESMATQVFILSATLVVLTVSLLRDQRRELSQRLAGARGELAEHAEQMNHAELRLRMVIDHAPIGVATVKADADSFVVLTANSHLLSALDYSDDAIVGARFRDVLHPDDHADWSDLCGRALDGVEAQPSRELRIRRRDGAYIVGRIAAIALPPAGEDPPHLLVMVEDITAQRRAERALGFSVARDPVTKLANHMIFSDRLYHALAASTRSQLAVGVLAIDIDGFRAVNEAVGHTAADHVLATMADRLTGLVRPGDTVARLGGDAFAIICPETSLRGLDAVAQRVTEEMARPVKLPAGSIRVTASVGSATATGNGPHTARDALRRADAAMYRAKLAGRDRVAPFEAEVISLRPS